QLLQDNSPVFFLPFPSVLQELLTCERLFVYALLFQQIYYFGLSSDRSMIGARYPKCIFALHSSTTDQNILNRIVQHMPHVKDASDIWRWHSDHIRFLVRIYFR